MSLCLYSSDRLVHLGIVLMNVLHKNVLADQGRNGIENNEENTYLQKSSSQKRVL